MKLKLKKDSNNVWSFVETWDSKYKYNNYGSIKVIMGISLSKDSYESIPLQHKEGVFQPISTSLDSYTLEQWVSSKKPVYSLVKGMIVRFVIRYSLDSLEPDLESSYFEVYQPIFDLATEEYVPLTRVFNVSSDLNSRLNDIMLELFGGSVDRVTFLGRRLAFEGNKD